MIKEIKGYEDLYSITSDGQVWSNRTNKFLLPHFKNGYLRVELNNGAAKKYLIHRLVAEAYLPNPNKYAEVNHIDCNRENNSVENLEWCDRKYNCEYVFTHGARKKE